MAKKYKKRGTKEYFTDEMVRSPWFWVVLAILFFLYLFLTKTEEKKEPEIGNTTTQITSMKEIEEWEFLTIHLEELVDTIVVRKFNNLRSTKIYKGNARLGIDMKKCGKNWAVCKENSANITLPPIELIDKEIIDETQTQTFYEEGKISATIKNEMRSRAKREMKKKALKKENLQAAEQNAQAQFKKIFSALGYQDITIKFQK